MSTSYHPETQKDDKQRKSSPPTCLWTPRFDGIKRESWWSMPSPIQPRPAVPASAVAAAASAVAVASLPRHTALRLLHPPHLAVLIVSANRCQSISFPCVKRIHRWPTPADPPCCSDTDLVTAGSNPILRCCLLLGVGAVRLNFSLRFQPHEFPPPNTHADISLQLHYL